MKLSFENIGVFKQGKVDLNGITVICGDNNTGKSTVGKILFCIFNACYRMQDNIMDQIRRRLLREIEKDVESYLEIEKDGQLSFEDIMDEPFQCSYSDFKEFTSVLSDDKTEGIKQVEKLVFDHLKSNSYDSISNHDELNERIYNHIKDNLKKPIDPYRLSRVRSFFNGVFGNQIINVKQNKAKVIATTKDGDFDFSFIGEDYAKLKLNFEFTNKAIFIDSPDGYKTSLSDWDPIYSRPLRKGRNNSLLNLVDELLADEYTDSMDVNRSIIEARIAKIDSIINKAVKGRFMRKNGIYSNSTTGGFQFDNLDDPISISNLSTGVKAFLLLRTLLKTGKISDRDVLILDEPEIHLHPEWQMVYAEAIVQMQKEFELTVLITSHSSAFVRAIECYCDYYDRMQELDVYRTKELGNFEFTIENLSYMECGVSELYDDFSRTYSKLDELLEEKYK